MAASLKDKRTPITTPPYQVPSVDVTPDPPIFSLVTTFKYLFCVDILKHLWSKVITFMNMDILRLTLYKISVLPQAHSGVFV
jgi:hypothetical protein